jgi:DNA-binding beta-propeller fold protein YncE
MPRQVTVIAVLLTIVAATAITGCAPKQQPTPVAKQSFAFWPPAPDAPHVQFLTAVNSSKDIAPKTKGGFDDMIYGAEQEQVLAVQKPYGVRMWNGRIYVTEIRSVGVTVLDLVKQQTRVMGATGRGQIKKAVDVAIAPDGTKYVVDQGDSSIKVFNADERFVTSYPLENSRPGGACVFGPYLYVTDFAEANVKILDRNYGKVLKTFGERGGLDGQFIGPLAIAADKQGCVYVSDAIRARVQKFGPDGTFMMGFGSAGNRPGNFVRPKHLGVGSDGHIHVVDAAFNNVQVFDPQGKFVGYYGSRGTHPGAMDLPAGLEIVENNHELFARFVHPAFQAERIVIVANQFGAQKLGIYAMGGLKEGKTVADLGTQANVASGAVPTTQPSATQPSAPPPATLPPTPAPSPSATQPTDRLVERP